MRYFIFFVALLLSSQAHAKSFGNYEGAIYVRNYDGDTVTFNLPGLHPIIGEKITIRVNGIDTPEIKGKCKKEKNEAKQAKQLVSSILKKSKKIELINMKRGKYFRIAADVIADGENLSDLLIKEGMAIKYDGGTKTHKWCGLITE